MVEVYGTSCGAGGVTLVSGSPGSVGHEVEVLHWNFGSTGVEPLADTLQNNI